MKKFLFCILIFIFTSLPLFAYDETLIVLDASVSMLDSFDGSPKYISAIKEAKNILNNMNKTEKIGLRTIGVTLDSSILAFLQDPNQLCKATSLLVPINSYSIDNINSSLDSIFPLGTTPLEYALSMAVYYDFSKNTNTKKHLILITDGSDSCNGDPCKFIRKIMTERKDITIDIIAIGVNADDFKQLNCITSASSGSIFNVKNSKDLNIAFKKVLDPSININTNLLNNINSSNTKYKNYAFQFYN